MSDYSVGIGRRCGDFDGCFSESEFAAERLKNTGNRKRAAIFYGNGNGLGNGRVVIVVSSGCDKGVNSRGKGLESGLEWR